MSGRELHGHRESVPTATIASRSGRKSWRRSRVGDSYADDPGRSRHAHRNRRATVLVSVRDQVLQRLAKTSRISLNARVFLDCEPLKAEIRRDEKSLPAQDESLDRRSQTHPRRPAGRSPAVDGPIQISHRGKRLLEHVKRWGNANGAV